MGREASMPTNRDAIDLVRSCIFSLDSQYKFVGTVWAEASHRALRSGGAYCVPYHRDRELHSSGPSPSMLLQAPRGSTPDFRRRDMLLPLDSIGLVMGTACHI